MTLSFVSEGFCVCVCVRMHAKACVWGDLKEKQNVEWLAHTEFCEGQNFALHHVQ